MTTGYVLRILPANMIRSTDQDAYAMPDIAIAPSQRIAYQSISATITPPAARPIRYVSIWVRGPTCAPAKMATL